MLARNQLVLAAFAVLVSPSWAADDGGVSPYRPSISNPAELPTPGQLELEFGGLHEKKGSARDDSLPYLFKLGFSKEWGMLLGGDAHVWSRDEEGGRQHGGGDTTVTLKRAFIVNDATAFGLELGAKLPTARQSIGSGKADYVLNAIYSQDIGRVSMDANLTTTRVGAPDAGTGRIQTGLAAAFSVPLSQNWSGVAELSGVRQRGAPTTAQVLTALEYSPNKKFSIDAGFVKGLSRASQDWSFFTGFVVPIARLW